MRRTIVATLLSLAMLGSAQADETLQVTGAYARVSRPDAPTAAVFMTIENPAATPDRLLSASASVAEKTELHTHVMSAEGMMQMLEVPEGFAVPAGGSYALDRGGDHVMLIGLTRPLSEGDRFTLDLTFETAGKVVVVVTVGDAAPDAGSDATTDHGGHGTINP
jgi:periplasmic copper chaperone A